MNASEMRVAVAKDVIERIDTYQFSKAVYLTSEEYSIPLEETTGDLQNILPTVEQNCQMCAIGALLVSKARLFNDVPIQDVVMPLRTNEFTIASGVNNILKLLGKVFPDFMLYQIEATFVQTNRFTPYPYDSNPKIRDAATYGLSLSPDLKLRVKSIMQNIIDNKGEFIIPIEQD